MLAENMTIIPARKRDYCCCYPNQLFYQPAYICIDLRRGLLYARYAGDNTVDKDTYCGFKRRLYFPPIAPVREVNKLLRKILPISQKILQEADEDIRSGNVVCVLSSRGQKLLNEIAVIIDRDLHDF